MKTNWYIGESIRHTFRRAAASVAQRHFARSAAGSFFLKIVTTVLAFTTSLLLARCLGVEGYGIYAYVGAWIGLLAVPAGFGFDRLVVRQVAAYHVQEKWSLMRGLIHEAHKVSLLCAVLLSLIACGVVWFAIPSSNAELRKTFWLALLLLPLLTLINIRQAIAQGLRQVVRGLLPDTLIRPALLILFIVTTYAMSDVKLSPSLAMELNIAATVATFLIAALILRSVLPLPLKEAEPAYEMRAWLGSAPPLLLIIGLTILSAQVSTLMLGSLQGTGAVGIYNASNRLAEQIAFVLVVVNFTLAPNIAGLWAARDVENLQRLITKSVRVVVLTSVPVTLMLVVFGRTILGLFGAEFTAGYVALNILCIGQLANTVMGSVGLLLIMTNHERDVAIAYGVSISANLVLGALLIPKWNIEGAAVARLVSVVLWNALLLVQVNRRLGINPSVFRRM